MHHAYDRTIELRQLRSFVALAEERHFTRAAARLHIAQPALSQQLRRLEREAGLALVDRSPHHVALTDAGERLLRRARTILAEVDAAQAELAQLGGVVAGRLTIGVTQTPGPLDVAALLAAFHERHPGVALDVREGLSVELAAQLRADAVDVAFVTTLPDAAAGGIHTTPLAEEDLVLVVGDGHRLARRRAVRIEDLDGERLVAFRRGATIRAAIEAWAAERAVRPIVAFEATDPARTRALVAAGLAVGVLPAGDARAPGPPVRALPFRGRRLRHRLHVAVREGRALPPAATALRDLALERAG